MAPDRGQGSRAEIRSPARQSLRVITPLVLAPNVFVDGEDGARLKLALVAIGRSSVVVALSLPARRPIAGLNPERARPERRLTRRSCSTLRTT